MLQSGWAYGRTLLPTNLPPLVLPNMREMIMGWGTAVPPLTLPTLQLNLPVYQWAILVTLALIIWLLGARLLFSDPANPPGRHS
ncbi:MAG: hypothetical protein HC804_12710 [Anaerolineae bacterium]|nr:hypothetical protein [Anaerolineae bacterium]